jgi:hypothetical protein
MVRVIKRMLFVHVFLMPSFLFNVAIHGQVVAAGRAGPHVVAGGFFSTYRSDYGPNNLWGPGVFIDLDLGGHLGLEGEARFLRFNQNQVVYEDSYALGLRYRLRFRHYEPYGKILIGNGQFNFPYNYGHGGYLLIAPGAGVNVHYHHIIIRAIEYEHQHWFSFQNSSLSPAGLSAGIGYRFF